MSIEETIEAVPNRQSWLAERKTGIGASDSPAVLGVSPWRSAFQVWAEKCGVLEDQDLSDNEAVEFGIRLERPVAEAYSARTGRHVEMWPQFSIVRDHERSWFCCTPDATQVDDNRGEGLLQVKTTSAYNAADWVDGPPLYYQVQLQHELAVTGFEWGTLVVLIGGQKLRYFDCDRNERFISALIPRLESFWQLVESRQPPEVDGSLVTAKVLAKLHPEDSGETIVLPPDAAEWTEVIQRTKDEIKVLEGMKTDAENHLKAAMGDSTFGMLPDGSRWSWKTQSRAGYTVDPSKCRVLRKLK